MNEFSISKSSFIKFIQCSKAFYLHSRHPYLRDKVSIGKQLTFDRGHQVGNLARQLFPGGVDVTETAKNSSEAVELTRQLISVKTPTIYEATFLFDGVLIMVDILHLDVEKYFAYEVKSSLKISETYMIDACLQYYVLRNSLHNFEDLFLVNLNKDYVLEDELNVKRLFKRRSVKKEAEKNLGYFAAKIHEAKFTLEKGIIPDIQIGRQCFSPYQCDFFGSCWKNTGGEKSVFNLPMVNKDLLFEWNRSGISDISQLSMDQIENEKIKLVKQSFDSGADIINKALIEKALEKAKGKIAAIDMEVWSPAVPRLKGTKPFQQIPFLFCVDDGGEGSFFICEYFEDDRKQFALELISQTEEFDTLLVYDHTLEEMVVDHLMKMYPDLEEKLNDLKEKLLDISEIFKSLDYYRPAFKNNFSLKSIAEAMELDVKFEPIRSGLEAMHYFESYRSQQNPIEKQALKEDLVHYCFSDCRATLLLYRFLQNAVK
jgi:hypothetical protein